jgi:hypothetical protein
MANPTLARDISSDLPERAPVTHQSDQSNVLVQGADNRQSQSLEEINAMDYEARANMRILGKDLTKNSKWTSGRILLTHVLSDSNSRPC